MGSGGTSLDPGLRGPPPRAEGSTAGATGLGTWQQDAQGTRRTAGRAKLTNLGALSRHGTQHSGQDPRGLGASGEVSVGVPRRPQLSGRAAPEAPRPRPDPPDLNPSLGQGQVLGGNRSPRPWRFGCRLDITCPLGAGVGAGKSVAPVATPWPERFPGVDTPGLWSSPCTGSWTENHPVPGQL